MNIPKQINAFLNFAKFTLKLLLPTCPSVLNKRYDLPNITEEIITKSHKTTLGQASAFIPSKPRSLILEASFIMMPEKQSKNTEIIISVLLLVIQILIKTQRNNLSKSLSLKFIFFYIHQLFQQSATICHKWLENDLCNHLLPYMLSKYLFYAQPL